ISLCKAAQVMLLLKQNSYGIYKKIIQKSFILVEVHGLSESLQEVMVRLPKNLLNEVDGIMKFENSDLSDFICQATKNYLEAKREEHVEKFYESMQKGYEEMARINLTIASEAFQAEEEAEDTLERTVIGV